MADAVPVQDRRVTRVFEWLSGIAASVLIIVLVWVGSTLTEVKETVAVLKAQSEPVNGRIDRIETKMEAMKDQSARIELRLTSMEARQVRQVGQ